MKSVIKLGFVTIALLSFAACNPNGGFKKIAGGVEYKIFKAGSGKTNIKVGDVCLVHLMNITDKDSTLMDSHKGMNGGVPKPFEIPVREAKGKYDIMAWLQLLKKGDSAVFILPTDSIFTDEKTRPAFISAHSKVKTILVVVDVMNQAEAQQKQMQEMQQEAVHEDELIQSYIKEKGLKDVQKTASGLYYMITKKGIGANIAKGDTAVMNYSGYLLNGQMFDSNIDTSKHHVEPFKFKAGQGMVIRGWDEGVQLLNKGAKAKFIIPSTLGYGPRAMGNDIPANSVLVFDVELKSFKK